MPEDLPDILNVRLLSGAEDQDIVQVHENKLIVHNLLEIMVAGGNLGEIRKLRIGERNSFRVRVGEKVAVAECGE